MTTASRLLTLLITYAVGCRVGHLQRIRTKVHPPEIINKNGHEYLKFYMHTKTGKTKDSFILAKANTNRRLCPILAWSTYSHLLPSGMKLNFYSQKTKRKTHTEAILKSWREAGEKAGLPRRTCRDISGGRILAKLTPRQLRTESR